jgi:hypothetical protein
VGGFVPELYVEVEAMRRLLERLAHVAGALEQAAEPLSVLGPRLGSPRLQAALQDFHDGWRHGRGQIVERIEGMRTRGLAALASYQRIDQAIADAAQSGTPGPSERSG